jgi:DHA1 family bicyclomycin/chloramphenicol resistance-like MFS transporter
MWILTFFLGISRPPSNNLILEQVDHGVGSASALIVFTFMTGGAMSMGLISLAWGDKIAVLGTMAVIVASLTLVFWLKFRFRFLPLSAN